MNIPGWRHVYSGKVRDLYESDEASKSDLILIVASDRISAFDRILEPDIKGKGENLTAVSNFWFDQLEVPNHRELGVPIPEEVIGRATVAKKLKMFPVECVVRGYLSGSGYKEYLATGSVCGIKLPKGLASGDKLPDPIFTPAFKAELGSHDENITFERVIELIGSEQAEKLKQLSLEIYERASALAEKAGLILADTKFEFGLDPKTQQVVLGDEVLTPDSSRYWDRDDWLSGNRSDSFDKQIIRNWLLENWDPSGDQSPPHLPGDLVSRASARYAELRQRLQAATQ